MMDYRIERDAMGEVRVPASAYYGAQTQRAVENFPISDRRIPHELIRALGIVKHSAAEANMSLGILDPSIGDAIAKAAAEVMEGRLDGEFVVDIYQTGSGTSTNMNANEVIANRAIELLGGTRGSRSPVHPNDHVNRSQSSNDVIPSAIHIACLESVEGHLIPALARLRDTLARKSRRFRHIVKTGRTHLQDAVPIRLGQEFSGYASQMEHAIRRVKSAGRHLRELPLGGTAVGTGLNAPKGFARLAIRGIREITGIPFVPARNPFESIAARDALVETSGQLKTVATSLMKIANDLRWMSSGPRCGIGEIRLPSLQPGSSIMPGKVNPVIPESVMMLCATVMGHDVAINIGGQHGNFELNCMMPMMAEHLLESVRLLANGSRNLAERCIVGIEADEKRTGWMAEQSLALSTSLAPLIGYDLTAEIAEEAHATGRTIHEIVRERGILSEARLGRVLDPRRLTKPGLPG